MIKPRPLKIEKQMYSQRLPKELVKKVQAKAKKENVSIAEIIEEAFKDYLALKIK